MRISREGKYTVFILSCIVGIDLLFSRIWVIAFFLIPIVMILSRDPIRITAKKKAIFSPVDGFISDISEDIIDSERFIKITIRTNFYNVLRNISPTTGVVKKIESNINDDTYLSITIDDIILKYLQPKHKQTLSHSYIENIYVKVGQPMGMYRFTGVVEVLIPDTIPVVVLKGQTMVGAETVLAGQVLYQEKEINNA